MDERAFRLFLWIGLLLIVYSVALITFIVIINDIKLFMGLCMLTGLCGLYLAVSYFLFKS